MRIGQLSAVLLFIVEIGLPAYNEQEKEKAKQEHREPIFIRHFSVHNLRHTFLHGSVKTKPI